MKQSNLAKAFTSSSSFSPEIAYRLEFFQMAEKEADKQFRKLQKASPAEVAKIMNFPNDLFEQQIIPRLKGHRIQLIDESSNLYVHVDYWEF